MQDETSSGISATGMPDELVAHCVEQQECSRDLAIAFNNKLVDCVDGTLVEYATVTDYKSGNGMSLRNFGRLQQLVAGTATFTALSTTGSVYTWGDARYQSCLARQPSDGWYVQIAVSYPLKGRWLNSGNIARLQNPALWKISLTCQQERSAR